MTATLHVKPTDGGEWTELQGVTMDEPSMHVQTGRLLEATRHEPIAPDAPAPLTAWQQVKLRIAMRHALLLARWVMVKR